MEYNLDTDYLLFAGENNEPEIFYTLEGEGEYVGQPSVFLRFFGCNLTCKAFSSADAPFGCDSFVSWSKKNKLTFCETLDLLEAQGHIDRFKQGAILKITGGEPMIRQDQLLKFMSALVDYMGFLPHIDIETNATIVPRDEWFSNFAATFTTSPKLANNGDPEEKRYNPEALEWHVKHNSGFKFVIQQESDIEEITQKYIDKFSIDLRRVWFMPCCGSREEHTERATEVAEWAKQHYVNFSPRLHLLLWNKALRV